MYGIKIWLVDWCWESRLLAHLWEQCNFLPDLDYSWMTFLLHQGWILQSSRLIHLCWSFHLDRSLLDDIFAPPRIDITCITWQSWVGSDQPDKWWKLYYIEGEAVEKMKNGQSWQITNISITILFSSGRPRPYGWKIDKVCCQKPGRGNGGIKSGLY